MDKKLTPTDEGVVNDANDQADDGRTDVDRELERVESIESTLGAIATEESLNFSEPVQENKTSEQSSSSENIIIAKKPAAVEQKTDVAGDKKQADELADEIIVRKSEPKTEVKAEPKPEVKPEPKTVVGPAKPAEPAKKQVNTDALLDKMRHEIAGPAKPKKHLSVGAVLAAVMIIGLIGAVAWLVFDKNQLTSQISSLNSELTTAKSAASSWQTTTQTTPTETTSSTVNQAVQLRPWDVQYTLSDYDPNVSYTLRMADKTGAESLTLSTVDLVRTNTNRHVSVAQTDAVYGCSNSAFFGYIMRTKASDIEKDGAQTAEAQAKKYFAEHDSSGNATFKKVGDYYYALITTSSTGTGLGSCLPDSPTYSTEEAKVDALHEYAKKVVQNLEPIATATQ